MSAPPIMSVTDELIAELEREAGAASFVCCEQYVAGGEYMGAQEMICCGEGYHDGVLMAVDSDTVFALLSERAELKRDAERYLAALTEAKYRIEQGRVWNGMGWTLTGLHSHGQQKAIDAIEAALAGSKELEL